MSNLGIRTETPVNPEELGVDVTPPEKPAKEGDKAHAQPPAPAVAAKEPAAPKSEADEVSGQILSTLEELNEYLREQGDLRAKPAEEVTPDDLADLRESAKADGDERMLALLEKLDSAAKRIQTLEAESHANRQTAELNALEQDIKETMERFPGLNQEEVGAILQRWDQVSKTDDRATYLTFEEFARRTMGHEALEARRVKGAPSPTKDKGTPPPEAKIVTDPATGGAPEPVGFKPSAVTRLDAGDSAIYEAEAAALRHLQGQ